MSEQTDSQKASSPTLQPSPPSEDAGSDAPRRQRCSKACIRCRLKKSKCDGATPQCRRCREEDFPDCRYDGPRRTHERPAPKGYCELLERAMAMQRRAVRLMYKELLAKKAWPGEPLPVATNGLPSTQTIFEALGILAKAQDPSFDHPYDDNVDSAYKFAQQEERRIAKRRDHEERRQQLRQGAGYAQTVPVSQSMQTVAGIQPSTNGQMFPGPVAYPNVQDLSPYPPQTFQDPQVLNHAGAHFGSFSPAPRSNMSESWPYGNVNGGQDSWASPMNNTISEAGMPTPNSDLDFNAFSGDSESMLREPSTPGLVFSMAQEDAKLPAGPYIAEAFDNSSPYGLL